MPTIEELQDLYIKALTAFGLGLFDGKMASYQLDSIEVTMTALYLGLIGNTPKEVEAGARELWAAFSAQDYDAAYAVAQRLVARR